MKVEQVFACYNYNEEKKIKLASLEFERYTLVWWNQVRSDVALASWRNWKLWQLDVKSAFLNGPLDEEVFIVQPPGFISKGNEQKVLKLHIAASVSCFPGLDSHLDLNCIDERHEYVFGYD